MKTYYILMLATVEPDSGTVPVMVFEDEGAAHRERTRRMQEPQIEDALSTLHAYYTVITCIGPSGA